MKTRSFNLLQKLAVRVAALAMLLAASNVSSTCIFMTYQPDIPCELESQL